MASKKRGRNGPLRIRRRDEAIEVLSALKFGARQRNEIAAYTLLALLDLTPEKAWSESESPLLGITPIIKFIGEHYGQRYAPNTRETIRDEAVKFFVGAGLLLRNPDQPNRPINGKVVYQIEPTALTLLRKFDGPQWPDMLKRYLASIEHIKREIERHREMTRVPVTLSGGKKIALSPGGQNPLIKAIIEDFCSRFVPGGVVVYIGDTENKFAHLEREYLAALGIALESASKMPDVIVHFSARNWLLLIEAVTSAGPVDGKRRQELKELFKESKAGLVFVTAFATRVHMKSFLPELAWESEVWIAEAPEHMIHFDGDKFLGPYTDTMPHA